MEKRKRKQRIPLPSASDGIHTGTLCRDGSVGCQNCRFGYLTPTYLSAVFKKQTGLTIGQYLLGIRVEHAKQKMKDPQLKFYQISEQVGYADANYFAKIFKKMTGMTPTEYKESLRL